MENLKYRVIYEYEFHRGTSAAKTARRINDVYGDGVAKENTVRFWFQRFRSGNFDLQNKPRGRPETKVDNEELKAIVEADPSQTTSELAAGSGVSDKTILIHLKQIGKVKPARISVDTTPHSGPLLTLPSIVYWSWALAAGASHGLAWCFLFWRVQDMGGWEGRGGATLGLLSAVQTLAGGAPFVMLSVSQLRRTLRNSTLYPWRRKASPWHGYSESLGGAEHSRVPSVPASFSSP
ncbi:unnamed protein product [Plutella xylostella]|uniref:(diamondback moth) hypothetical protein n=1 Tax=Plutella xylostella TaxID=51655 RepID=A0A8S4G8D4_PLUXY|nr:unnamed protein product [Plutella xylostella]